MKDKETRESKGVAFVLFVERTAAHRAITALNRKELFGRTIKCSVAKDNGRASEFIRRKTYRDKTRYRKASCTMSFSTSLLHCYQSCIIMCTEWVE